MATRTGTRVDQNNGVILVTWEGITEADQGNAIGIAEFANKTVQVVGDFTTSGAITLEGSNDGSTFGALHDILGADLVLTDSEPRKILENPVYIRPRATAGTAVDMDVIIVATKNS